MTELGTEARELIEAGRAESFDPTRIEKNRAALIARVGAVVGVGVASTGATAAASALSISGLAGSTKILAVLVLAGGFVGGYAWLRDPEPAAPSPGSIRRELSTPERSSRAVEGVDEKTGDPAVRPEVMREDPPPPRRALSPAKRRRVTPAPASAADGPTHSNAMEPASPEDDGTLAVHAQCLARARSALREGRPEHALRALDGHPEIAAGPLGEDWKAARALILCALGRKREADEATSQLQQDHPTSIHLARVRAACASSRAPSPDASDAR